MPHPPDSVQSPFASIRREKPLGRVFLVGAGPGDPGLLTIRGLNCLQNADVVLYDGLASEELLEFAVQAECVSVGKHGQTPLWTQANINRKIVELANSGKRVVRLKGGDPAVFARTAEELEVLIAEKIPFEVVPGITAALAAASYVGIPITHRHHASAVALITGQQQSDEPPQPMDWSALARFPGTLVFYMGVTTVGEWTSKLMASGKSPQTAAAIVRRCTWSDQTVIRCRLGEVAEHLTPASKMRPPVIVIVGAVANLGEDFDWFTSRPLHGCGVLVTRAEHQSESLVHDLRQLGAEVFLQPAFTVQPPNDLSSLDKSIDALLRHEFSGVTFSSVNGVDGLLRRIAERGFDSRIFARCRLAAVGAATAERLTHYGLRCDILPAAGSEHSARGLLASLTGQLTGQSWLVTTTNRSGSELPDGLRNAGATVQQCLCYQTEPVKTLKPNIKNALEASKIHFVTISSAFVAVATHQLLGEHRAQLAPISLSQSVAQKLQQLDWPASRTAESHSTQALIDAMLDAWHGKQS